MAEQSTHNHHIKTIHELLGLPEEFFERASSEEHHFQEPEVEVKPSLSPQSQEYQPKQSAFSRDIVRYPLIFLVALGFFYLVLNFRAVSQQFAGSLTSSTPPEAEAADEGDSAEFRRWMKKYYVYISDPEILAAGEDADHDGLTNLQEFYLGTNPLKQDTDQDGYDDGGEVLTGYNPLYEGKLKSYQKEIIAQHINFSGPEQVAGEIIRLPVDNFQLDPSQPGRIEISKIGVEAPIIWSKEFAQMEEDLKRGVAHHPQTRFPGEQGLASIHGHSSGYPWDGNFKYAFTKINFLEPGDEVFVTVFSTNGESRRYKYIVRSKKVFAKDDPVQFAPTDKFLLNLSTSWPPGTARERYVVQTELIGL